MAKKRKGTTFSLYGDVLEVYTPDFRPPIINSVDVNQINPTVQKMQVEGFGKEEIWRRIGDSNTWSDVTERYRSARIESLDTIFDLKERFEKKIHSNN